MDNENKNPLLPEEEAFPAEGMEWNRNAGSFQEEEQSSGEMPVAPPESRGTGRRFFRRGTRGSKFRPRGDRKGDIRTVSPETMEPPIEETP